MSTRKDYEDIIDQLGFVEKLAIKKNFKKGKYIVRGDIRGRDVLLKIVPRKNKHRVETFKKENTIIKLIEKHNENFDNPLINITKVLVTGRNKKYFWIIRRYYPGTSMARLKLGKPLLGYDKIRPKFIIKRGEYLNKITESITALQGLTNDFRKLGVKKELVKYRHFENIKINNPKKLEKELGIDLSDHQEFYKKIKKTYLSKENIVATQADLTPANIIIRSDGMLYLSDFELFCFDNYTLDIAYLWIFLFRYPKWQKGLLENTINNDQDRDFFRASIIRILFQQIYWPAISASIIDKEKKVDYTKRHKWFKYLVASGESFEALMKIK